MSTQIDEGKCYSFCYCRGTRAGQKRKVYVIDKIVKGEIYAKISLVCFDFNIGAVRRYGIEHIKGDISDGDCQFLNMSMLPSSVDGDEVVDGFRNDGRTAFYDKDRQVVVIDDKPRKEIRYVLSSNEGIYGNVAFYDKKDGLNITLYKGSNVIQRVILSSDDTIYTMLEKLQQIKNEYESY